MMNPFKFEPEKSSTRALFIDVQSVPKGSKWNAPKIVP